MQKTKVLLTKFISLIILLFLPWMISLNSNETAYPNISKNSVPFYQSNTCDLSFFKFLIDNSDADFELRLDTPASLECFGKINGGDIVNEKVTVYLGTNINIDLITQSIFWLILFSFIPKSKKFEIKYKNFYILTYLTLIWMHYFSEINFYDMYSKTFSKNISNSFTLYSLLLTHYLISRVYLYLIESRYNNLINYIPYLFVFVGTYNSQNLNFYLISLSILGIVTLTKNNIFKIYSVFYIGIVYFWTSQSNKEINYFDIDKLKGFSSSSYNIESIFFWSVTYFLVLVAVLGIIKNTSTYLDVQLLTKNLLTSGFLVVLMSFIATLNPATNFYTYYYLGLNKSASNTLESVAGNAWRGISASAESIGEFFAIVLMFTFFIKFLYKKEGLTKFEIFLVLINFFGLYRSNNFSAFISMIVICIIATAIILVQNNKLKFSLVVFAIMAFPIVLLLFFNNYSIEESSRKLIKEGLEISYIENLETNEFGQTPIDQNRFLEFLNSQETLDGVSTSLVYLIEKYHYSERNYLPNITSLISSTASQVNRSEKWGIFFGKYSPNSKTLMFGTGVNNLSSYYNSHLTKVNDGLVLPHSSFLSYLVFFGIFGILGLLILIAFLVYKYKKDHLYVFLTIFLLINLLKNDSLLYFNNFVLYIFIFNLYKLKIYERFVINND